MYVSHLRNVTEGYSNTASWELGPSVNRSLGKPWVADDYHGLEFCEGYGSEMRYEVQNSTEYIIGRQIARYATPWIILPGILGNFLSFIVATRAHNRSLPFGVYMASLACADTFMLSCGQLYGWIMFHFLSTSMNKARCQVLLFMYSVGGNVGAWIIVALTVERYLLVCRSRDHVRFRSLKTTYVVVIVIIVVCMGKNVHYFFTAEFLRDSGYDFMICAIGFVRADPGIIVLQVFELCFNSVIPFVFILILNGCIIYRLRQQAKTRRNRLGRKSTCASTASAISSKAPRDEARGLTGMLLAISWTFACLTSPLFVFRFSFAFVTNVCQHPDLMAKYVLIDNILGLLYASNFSVNFILYCLTGTLFREDLSNIFKKLSERMDISHHLKLALPKSYSVNLKSNATKTDDPKMLSLKNISELNVAALLK